MRETATGAKVSVLKNADVKFAIPFAIDILLFGYNHGTDVVTAGEQPSVK